VAPGSDAHYFDEQPTVAADPIDVDVALPDVAFTMRTDHGVFGRAQLDAGTRHLLHCDVPVPQTGHLLDLGCGAGPIALALARRAPAASVWAIDVNARARALCAGNAERNGITNIEVVPPDAVPRDIHFAAIWSNPPIRIGKKALHQLLARWLDRLEDGGHALLVVHRHLGADSLQAWLRTRGHPTGRIASRSGYRILRVEAQT
jgi:16S rRNA G1207 methylase RsmC